MSTETDPRRVGARVVHFDERDLVYELRRRAVELHTRAARIEAKAWELNRELSLERAARKGKPCR
jgi:hypothetical protein